MPQQFEFCKVCRLNHDQGKGHKYSNKHKQRLAPLLAKAQQRVKDVSFFLKHPACLRQEDRQRNKYWCVFCEEDILELDSVYACSNAIRHLASATHLDKIKKFWFENGADVDKRHLYVFRGEDVAKWEDACKGLSHSAICEPLAGVSNNIHSTCSNSESICEIVSNKAFSHSSLNTVKPLPLFKDGNHPCTEEFCGRRSFGSQSQVYDSIPSSGGGSERLLHINNGHGNGATAPSGLTRLRQQPECSDGNVHSGAPPPWLMAQTPSASSNSQAVSKPLSRAQERKLKKIRNPKRVGAAWAEKRRAEMEMEARGEILPGNTGANSSWLPNFGRVWQTGTRRETRKEFEAEKWLQKDLKQKLEPEKPTLFQPYISKRQRLEQSTNQSLNKPPPSVRE